MAGVEAGGDRQDLHERVRVHSRDAGKVVKEQGEANDLMARLQADDAFAGVDLSATLDPVKYIGRAPEQTRRFVQQVVAPIRDRYSDALTGEAGELKV